MSAHSVIRSRSNPLLKRVGAVLAGKDRERVALEGDRLVEDARGAGWRIELALVAEDRGERARELERAGIDVRLVDGELLRRTGELKSSQGVLALATRPSAGALGDLDPAGAPLVLVVAGVADPGNLGALARSAEAFGAHAIVAVAGGASPWSSKALRGSMGSLLRLPVIAVESASEAHGGLRARGFRQRRAEAHGGSDPARVDWSGACALWVGGETRALPGELAVLERVTIPTAGRVESLNVAAATAVLLYAVARARADRSRA